jgi:hypothetical protein
MKTAVKVLCIIALIVGLIWAVVGFFGSWVGGAVSAAGQAVLLGDSKGAASTINNSAMLMIRLIGSFIFVIIAGVLGIVGSDKEPSKMKPIILGMLVFICGIVLFPLNNYIAAVLYIISGLILFLAGLTTKMGNVTLMTGEFTPTHKVKLLTESVGLGLRKNPHSSEETFIKIPNGTEIQHISSGDEINLDINETTHIKGFWYKIRTRDDVKGWCFSESLEKI